MLIGATFAEIYKRRGDAKNFVMPDYKTAAALGCQIHRIVMPSYPWIERDIDFFIRRVNAARAAGITKEIVEVPMISAEYRPARDVLSGLDAFAVKFDNEPDDQSPEGKWKRSEYRHKLGMFFATFGPRFPILLGGYSCDWDWWHELYKNKFVRGCVFDLHVLTNAKELPERMRKDVQMLPERLNAKPRAVWCTEVGTWTGTQFGITQTAKQQGESIVQAFEAANALGVEVCCGALWMQDNLGSGKNFAHHGLIDSNGRKKASFGIVKKYLATR